MEEQKHLNPYFDKQKQKLKLDICRFIVETLFFYICTQIGPLSTFKGF